MKRMIWDSAPVFDEQEITSIRSEMCDTDATDEEVLEFYFSELHPQYWEDEREMLNVELPGDVLVIADIGRWNGRAQGYRILSDNLRSILSSHVHGMSDINVFGDGYNIRADENHHDGSNHYLYRLIRSDRDPQPLLDAIYAGRDISSALLNRYTKSLYPNVANIYGWPCRQKLSSKKGGVFL